MIKTSEYIAQEEIHTISLPYSIICHTLFNNNVHSYDSSFINYHVTTNINISFHHIKNNILLSSEIKIKVYSL